MPRLTMSSLPRAFRCPASVVLPQIDSDSEDGRRGTELHDLIEGALVGDVRCIAECSSRGIDLDIINAWLPAGTAEPLLIEPKVAYNVRERTGRRVDLPGPRNYGECGRDEIPGSADLALWHDGVLYLADIKTGFHQDAVAGPAAENWQLRGLALALWWARPEDMPAGCCRAALLKVRADGQVDIDEVSWGPGDLSSFADELEVLWDRLEAPRPRVRTSSYCGWCPAILSCPATVEATALLARALPPPGIGIELAEDAVTSMPPEAAARAVRAWRHIKKVGEAVEQRARLLAQQDLLPGWRLVPRERRELHGGITHAALRDYYGPDAAREGVEISTTKELIKTALRAERDRRIAAALPAGAAEQDVAAEQKKYRGWLARAERELLAEVAARNGVETRTYETLIEDNEPAAPAEGVEEP